MGLIYGLIVGVALGIGVAYYVTVSLVKKSNDIGDSSATLRDVSDGVIVLDKEDNLHNPKY